MVNGAWVREVNDSSEGGGGGGKALSQAAIGRVLGLAPATMTKLKGQGMPVDSVESARAWRNARQNVAARKPEPKTTSAAPSIAAPASMARPVTEHPPGTGNGRVGGDVFHDMIRANEVKPDGTPLDEGYDDARTRREIAEANIAEIKEAELAGKVVEKTAVDKAFFEAARGLRDGMTNCSRRLAAEVATLSAPAECEEVIAKELRHLLDAFSKQLAQKIAPAPAPVTAPDNAET